MKKLNVLYLSDDNYAAFAGVSIYSLLVNNVDYDSIKIYVIDDNISEENKRKLHTTVSSFGREIVFLDLSEAVSKLKSIGVPAYRSSYTTYLKLFAFGQIDQSDGRVLFVDSDSVVVGQIDDLSSFNMGENAIAAVKDSLYVRELVEDDGIEYGLPYFNMGVMLVDLKKWHALSYEKKVIDLLKRRCHFFAADQDILNTIANGRISCLPPRFNCTPHLHDYSYKGILRVFPQKDYYAVDLFEEAKKRPVIHHFERYIGQQPWIKNNHHPFSKEYDYYLAKSPWAGLAKQKKKMSFVFRVEVFLYILLPHALFLPIFAFGFKNYVKKTISLLRKKRLSVIN